MRNRKGIRNKAHLCVCPMCRWWSKERDKRYMPKPSDRRKLQDSVADMVRSTMAYARTVSEALPTDENADARLDALMQQKRPHRAGRPIKRASQSTE